MLNAELRMGELVKKTEVFADLPMWGGGRLYARTSYLASIVAAFY